MVNKAELDNSLQLLKNDLIQTINNSISDLREKIVDNLVQANKELQGKVKVLESKVSQLEIDLQSSLQYNRLNNIIISGIPKAIEHHDLKEVSLGIMNTCLESDIGWRDMEACHRISKNSDDVVCRLINREDVEEVLANANKLNNIDKTSVGLTSETAKIYVNVHLTPHNSKLAFHCRKLKRENKIKKISTRKGIIKIFYVEDGGENPAWKTISHTKDLVDIFPDIEL